MLNAIYEQYLAH